MWHEKPGNLLANQIVYQRGFPGIRSANDDSSEQPLLGDWRMTQGALVPFIDNNKYKYLSITLRMTQPFPHTRHARIIQDCVSVGI